MTPIFVSLWFGWALKTGHQGSHLALFPGDCRNSQTRWRRGGDLNPRNPSEFTRSPGVRLNVYGAEQPKGCAKDRIDISHHYTPVHLQSSASVTAPGSFVLQLRS